MIPFSLFVVKVGPFRWIRNVGFHNVQTLEDLALEGFLEKKTVFGVWFSLHFKSFVTTIGSCHKEFASETMPTFAHKGKILEVVGSTRQLCFFKQKITTTNNNDNDQKKFFRNDSKTL